MYTPVRRASAVLLIAFVLAAGLAQDAGAPQSRKYEILSISVEGTITAGTTEFIKESIKEAEEEQYQALLVLIDNPGGMTLRSFRTASEVSARSVQAEIYLRASSMKPR